MPVYDDTCLLFLLGRQGTVIVDIEKAQDLLVGFLPTLILKNFHVNAEGIIPAETRSKLDFAVDRIVVFDEAADKSDDNNWMPCRGLIRRDGGRGNHWGESQEQRKKQPGETLIAGHGPCLFLRT